MNKTKIKTVTTVQGFTTSDGVFFNQVLALSEDGRLFSRTLKFGETGDDKWEEITPEFNRPVDE